MADTVIFMIWFSHIVFIKLSWCNTKWSDSIDDPSSRSEYFLLFLFLYFKNNSNLASNLVSFCLIRKHLVTNIVHRRVSNCTILKFTNHRVCAWIRQWKKKKIIWKSKTLYNIQRVNVNKIIVPHKTWNNFRVITFYKERRHRL